MGTAFLVARGFLITLADPLVTYVPLVARAFPRQPHIPSSQSLIVNIPRFRSSPALPSSPSSTRTASTPSPPLVTHIPSRHSLFPSSPLPTLTARTPPRRSRVPSSPLPPSHSRFPSSRFHPLFPSPHLTIPRGGGIDGEEQRWSPPPPQSISVLNPSLLPTILPQALSPESAPVPPILFPVSPYPLPCFPPSLPFFPPSPPHPLPCFNPPPPLLQPIPFPASPHPLPCLLLPPYRLPTLPPAHLTTSNPSLLIRAQVWRKVHVVRSILALGYDVVLTDRAVLWGVNSRAVVANADLFTVRSNTHTHAQVL
ncbi:unnamed protein product [Closterium sp. NIES-64]|nr:unnamed protein product [Closterium sp. NIES-64]